MIGAFPTHCREHQGFVDEAMPGITESDLGVSGDEGLHILEAQRIGIIVYWGPSWATLLMETPRR